MNFEITVSILALIIFIFFIILGYTSEKRTWNNGVCKENNKPWEYFDMDSQGGRGYKAGDIVCWISYPKIDRVKKGDNYVKN